MGYAPPVPLFSDPTAPPGWLETRRLLGRYAHLFLAIIGGAGLAMALSTSPLVAFPLALAAVVTSLTAPRAPRLTAAVEVMVLSAALALALALPAGREWMYFGVASLLVARAWSTWRAMRSQVSPPLSRRWRMMLSKPMVPSEHDDAPR